MTDIYTSQDAIVKVTIVENSRANPIRVQVPYLADAKEWGVDDSEEKEDINRWHRAKVQ